MQGGFAVCQVSDDEIHARLPLPGRCAASLTYGASKQKDTDENSVSFCLLLPDLVPVDKPSLPGVDRHLGPVGEV